MLLAGFIAFLSAFTFAASNTMVRKGVLTGTVGQAMLVTVPLGAGVSWLGVLASSMFFSIPLPSRTLALFCAMAGIVHFVIGRYLNYKAIQAMGSNLVGPVQQFSVVVTLLLANIVLGEVPTGVQAIGILAILLSPILLFETRLTAGEKVAFVPDRRRGYVYAFASAIAFGVSPILINIGLREQEGLISGLMAGAVAYTAAALVVTLGAFRRSEGSSAQVSRSSVAWYAISGVTVAVSQLLSYMSLAIAPVSVVIPIQRTAIVLRLGLARHVNRDTEVFGAKMVVASCLSLAGAVILTVDAGQISDFLAGLVRPAGR